jgi:hypothetical protein
MHTNNIYEENGTCASILNVKDTLICM